MVAAAAATQSKTQAKPAGGLTLSHDAEAITILLVDDDADCRMLIRDAIAECKVSNQVFEVTNGQEAFEFLRRAGRFANAPRPGLIYMDIEMPVLDGLATLAEVTADASLEAVKVVMLTTFELDDYVFAALRGGASGFVLKDAEPDELLRAVRVVAAGGSLLSPSVTRRVIEHFTRRLRSGSGIDGAGPSAAAPVPHPQLDQLTDREREIVAWVATGRSNDEIAAELVVSPATVRTHVSRAMVKLGARDRAQLVVFAVQSGLTT